MTRNKMLLIGLTAFASTTMARNPPPFGTVVRQWQLGMSGSYAGAGITWRRDSGRFYLVDQGYSGPAGMWSCTAEDPDGTTRRECCLMPNLGSGTTDIPWGIAWDGDSNCFWISDIVDGNILGGCYYVRIRQTPAGDTWRWFSENPGDTWLVGTGSGGGGGHMYWMGGSEKWQGRDYYACAPVASDTPYNYVWKFDPYTKSGIGRCTYGSRYSERGCTLVPYDSMYILTSGWNVGLVKRDSTGLVIDESASVYGPADIALFVPQNIGPDDTVFMYCISSDPNNTLLKVSVGMLWSQLPGGVAIAEPTLSPTPPAAFRIEPNPCHGSATIRLNSPLPTPYSMILVDAAGCCVRNLTASGRAPAVIDVKGLNAGIYFLRAEAGGRTQTAKLIVER